MKLVGIVTLIIVSFYCLFVPGALGQEKIKLIKIAGNSAVYFVDEKNTRHVFPNTLTYQSWYGDSFSNVVTVSKEYLSSLPLGKNVMVKPGRFLLNVPNTKIVYAPEPGGVLRPIQSEGIAKEMFGERWYEMIRPLPEIFFQNYVIGESIRSFRDVPDGLIVTDDGHPGDAQDASSEKVNKPRYHLKWKGTLQPLESEQTVRFNGYDVDHALVDAGYFSKRPRPINDRVNRFTDPLFEPNVSTLSCDFASLNLGIVVVTNREIMQGEMGVLRDAIFRLPSYYAEATEQLGNVTVENNVILMDFDNTFDDAEHQTLNFPEIARTYYDVHGDDIDFLAVFHTVYDDRQNHDEIARYVPVSNTITGTGKNTYNRANEFGSHGQLKGVLDMGNISQYAGDVGKGPNLTLGTIVHEMMHSVSGSMMALDPAGNTSDILLSKDDPFHWSRFLLETSFLGGDGWVAEGDGRVGHVQDGTLGMHIYQSAISSDPEFRRRFSDLDLYAFGLIPARSVQQIQYLEVNDRTNPTHRVEGTVKTVAIDEIIKLNGKRECVIR